MRGTTASQRRSTPATAAPPPPAIAPGEKAAPLADDAPLNFSAAALIATHSCLSCSTREARILLIYARFFSIPSRKFADKVQPVILSEAKDLPSRLSIFSEQIPRRCAPRDDRVGVFAGGIVSPLPGQDTRRAQREVRFSS